MRAFAHVRNCTRSRTIIVYMDRIIDRGRHIRIFVDIILACATVFVCAPHIHNNITLVDFYVFVLNSYKLGQLF